MLPALSLVNVLMLLLLLATAPLSAPRSLLLGALAMSLPPLLIASAVVEVFVDEPSVPTDKAVMSPASDQPSSSSETASADDAQGEEETPELSCGEPGVRLTHTLPS
jgi:hypothetical protein